MKFQQLWCNPVFANKKLGANSANEVSVALPPMRRIVLAASAVAMFIGLNGCPPVYSQTNTIWNGGSSNWNNAANWSGGFVPINGNGGTTWNVFIDNGNAGNSTTLLDVNSTIDQLHISTGDILNIGDSFSLGIVGGVLNNSGTININSGGNPTALNVGGSLTIGGTGTINMSGALARIGGFGTLTNGALHTISGNGNLGIGQTVIINQGTVQAGAGQNLTIDPVNLGSTNAAFTNSGTVRATGGGIVTLTGFDGGEFHGSGASHVFVAEQSSRIELVSNAVVRNARFATIGDGLIRGVSAQNATWVDVTNTGNFERADQGELTLVSSLVNSGNMRVVGGGNVTQISVSGLVNLSGGGTISLSGSNARIGGGGGTLNNVDNTISGTGNLGIGQAVIINAGIVQAGASENLTIDPVNLGSTNAAFTNSGTVRATGGGVVTLTGFDGGEFHGSGASHTFLAEASSRIDLIFGAVVRDAKFATAGNGLIRGVSGHSATWANVTNTGNFERADEGELILLGSLVNSGSMRVVGGGNVTQISASGAVSLTGGGTISLSGSNARIGGGGGTLTNVDNTISGTGNLGIGQAVIINQGTVQAGNGENLTIDPVNTGFSNPAFTNAGTVRATGGGIVTLTGAGDGEFHGSGVGHTFLAEASSRIDLIAGAFVRNAKFATTGNGVVRLGTSNNATWVDVTNTGNFEKLDDGGLALINSLVNSGSMRIVGGGNVTQISVNGAVNLSGGGTISLSGGNARIGGGSGTLTNVDNTISGTGNVGAGQVAVINQGTVQAGAGENLTIDPVNLGSTNAAFTNSGTVRASGGGVVTLTGAGDGEFHGSGASHTFVAEESSRIDLNANAIVRNARFATTGSGVVRLGTSNNATWVDVTNTGNFEKLDEGGLALVNSLVNSGSMRVMGGGNVTQISVSGPVNLSGGGTISLSGANARIGGGGTLTNVDNTISGTGNVGAGQVAVINQGTVQASAGQNLTIDPLNLGSTNIAFNNFGTLRADNGLITLTGSGGGEFAGSGLFEARNGGTLQFDGSAVVQNLSGGVLNSGTWRAGGGGGTIRFLNDATSSISTIGAAAAIELVGTGSNLFTRSTNIPLDSTLNNVQGNFTLRNGRVFNTPGALASSGDILLDGSATVLQVAGDYAQTGGSLDLVGLSTLDLNGVNNSVSAGFLSGNGSVIGNLALVGTSVLDPGFSAGRLDFADDLTWGAGATVRFDLGVNSAASDFITVDNLFKTGSGAWAFEFVVNGGITGQVYDLIDFGTTDFNLTDFSYTNASPFQGDFLYSGSLLQFRLNAVPEPSTIGFLTMTGLLMGLRRGRRKE